MVKLSTDDQELQRACKAAVEGTKQSVIMSICMAKSHMILGITHMLGRNGARMARWSELGWDGGSKLGFGGLCRERFWERVRF
ncbi:hypothetical protein ACFX13_019786 [Malus domestica]